jgi:sugar lactone lactonase YvrE
MSVSIRKGILARALELLACLLLLTGTQAAWGIYTVLYNGVVSHLGTGSVTNPQGVAVDITGNVYISDTGGGRILKVTPGGTPAPLAISGLTPALSAPNQLTVDDGGNLYIADPGNNRIVKVDTSGNGTVVSTPSFTLSAPQGVAVDTAGDIFISDSGNNRIVEVAAGGTASLLNTTSGVSINNTSLSTPKGLAVDTFGNLYLVDSGHNRVIKVTTALVGSNISTNFSPAISAPIAVAVSNNGTVYITDGAVEDEAYRVATTDSLGDYYDLLGDEVNPEFGTPSAIAVSPLGTVYIADTAGNQVNAFQVGTAGFGHVSLGSSGTPLTLNFDINESSTLTGVTVYTNGTPNLDFTIAANSGTPCITGSGGITCTVNVQFTPTSAGLRQGALVLSYTNMYLGSGNFTVPLFGYGDGPVAALSPGVTSVVNVGTAAVDEPFQTTTDGAGNIYVSSYQDNTILRIPAGGGSLSTVTIPPLSDPATISDPTGLAMDGAGNLFIADHFNNRIVELTAQGTSQVVSVSGLSGGFSFPTTLNFTPNGRLLVNDYGNGRIVMLSPFNGDGTIGTAAAQVLPLGSYTLGSDNSIGVASDGWSNVYFTDADNNRILKVDPLGKVTTVSLPNITLSGPEGVAVDPSQNLYVVDSGNQRIIQQTTSGATSVLSFSGPAPGPAVFNSAVDGSGNVLISDFVNGRLLLDNVSQSTLTFPTTREYTNSAAQTTTVTDLGDQALLFPADPAYTASFSLDPADTNPCTSATSLAAGMSCDVPILFSPQAAGNLSASIAVTDNTQNVTGSTQQIAVSGTSTNPGDSTTATLTVSPTASSYTYGQVFTLTAHVADTTTGHAADIPAGTVTFVDTFGTTMTQLGTITVNAAGNAVLANLVLNGIGTHSIRATYSGVSGSYLGSNTTATIPLSQGSVTIAGSAMTLAPGTAANLTITLTPQVSGGALPAGSVSYTIVNQSNLTVASGTVSLTPGSGVVDVVIPIPGTLLPGSYLIHISYSGDTDYQAATATPISLSIQKGSPTIGLAASANQILETSSEVFTATVSGTGGVATGTVSFYDGTALLGTVTLTQGTAAFGTSSLTIGTHSITASYSGSSLLSAMTSAALVVQVEDFSLSLSSGTGTASATANPGGTVTYPLSLAPVESSTFLAPVTLSLSGLPAGAAGSLSPSMIPAGSGVTPVTLTVQLPASLALLQKGPEPSTRLPAVLLGALLLPLAGICRRKRRGLRQWLAILVLLGGSSILLAGLSSCGMQNGFLGQAPTQYTIHVTATSGALTHTTQVSLTVQ